MAHQAVKILLQYKLNSYEVSAPMTTTFRDLKELAQNSTGIPAANIKLLYRGREKLDQELIMAAGVKNGSRIQIAETTEHRAAQPDPAASQSRHSHQNTGQHPGYAHHHASQSADGSRAYAASHSNNRAPDSWEQFSGNGPAHADAWAQPATAQQQSHARAHSHSRSPYPAHSPAQPQPSPRTSHFDANPHTSPRPGNSAHTSPRPDSLAPTSPRRGNTPQPGVKAQTPVPLAGGASAAQHAVLTPEQAIMQKIEQVKVAVDELSGRAEQLLLQRVLDKKQLRVIEEQLTQQLLALDKLEVAGESRVARKAQINRINVWADQLESLH